jgi:hypothetical protein
MAWVKKNLFLLIGALLSLAALGYAVFFVQAKKTADQEVTTQLDEAAEKYKQLITRKVHPGNEKVDNIQKAKDELVKMRAFMDEMREYLKGPELGTNVNNQIFRAQLDTSVSQMRRQAEEAGVALPNTNFWFTFTSYKTTVDFKGEMQGLAAELEDIKSIMRVLYDARVHSVAALKRAATSETEFMGTADYLQNRYPRTNDWAVSTPYEITFQGFSSELARVMEGLANAKQCFVVKTVGVAQAPEERRPNTPAPMMVQPMYNDPMARYRPQPQVQYIPRAAPGAGRGQPAGIKTVLDENKLRFTLQVDSIRLKGK